MFKKMTIAILTLIVLSAWLDKKDDIYIPIKKAA